VAVKEKSFMKQIGAVILCLFIAAALLGQAKTQIQKPPTSLPSTPQRGTVSTEIFLKITGADPECDDWYCMEIQLHGRNFGPRGSRRVICDGAPAGGCGAWTDTLIGVVPGDLVRFWPVHHTFYIDDGAGKALSNAFEVVFLYVFHQCSPAQGVPGTEIQVSAFGAGPRAGKSLWMGTTPMTINYWPSGENPDYITPIRAVVPHLAPGTYAITMHSGAQQVSKSSISFKVN
jgi:hypothetical protein